jgi:hypothetical protein
MSDARTEIHSANIVSDACPVPEPVAAVREPRVRRGASSPETDCTQDVTRSASGPIAHQAGCPPRTADTPEPSARQQAYISPAQMERMPSPATRSFAAITVVRSGLSRAGVVVDGRLL